MFSRKIAAKLERGHRAWTAIVQTAMLVLTVVTAGGALAKPIKIVALGDSLTAGFGLPAQASFPSVLERRLRGAGFDVEIVNAGVSGDTASGGLERLDWSIPDNTDLAIVELGANDMLRGISPTTTRAALQQIIERLRARKIGVLLAGMRSMTNWGDEYRAAFESIYPDLGRQFDLPLYPDFLEGVAGRPDKTLPDGLHPNAAGVESLVDKFMPFVTPVLAQHLAAPAGRRQN